MVEDDAALRDVIARHLRELGYQVSTAEDGQAALDRAARSPVQLVLSDVYMPNADAVRMMKVLEAITPGVKVLLMAVMKAANCVGINAL